MRRKNHPPSDELRSEYVFDYSKAVRGKYYRRLIREGANVAVLEPDVGRPHFLQDLDRGDWRKKVRPRQQAIGPFGRKKETKSANPTACSLSPGRAQTIVVAGLLTEPHLG